ncbi:MAG: MBL fold metallo-hydrolase [Chloroflexi bacterium]|nr:MBL fold metallo-hydrolase [Chloroflexota bacterium]
MATESGAVSTCELGPIRVHWLDGGAFRLDGGALFGPVPKKLWAQRYPCDANNLVPMAARPLLIETGGGWLLVDSGFGHHLPERLRRIYTLERPAALEASLARLGLAPEQIDWVVLTHLHLDHASGLVRVGPDGRLRPLFARARHLVQELEVQAMAKPHERERHAYDQAGWQPLVEAGLVELVQDTREVLPGVEVFRTGGHSRGHQGLRLAVGDTTALHLGDVLPTSAHLRPLWVSALDDYPLESIEVKRRWLGQAAAHGWWLTFYHDPRVLAGRCSAEYELIQPVAV